MRVRVALYSRLIDISDLGSVYGPLEPELPRPYIVPWYILPDLPNSGLIRTLCGYTGVVFGCAVNPAGDYIVSASEDGTLKLWGP